MTHDTDRSPALLRLRDPWLWGVPLGAAILLTLIYLGDENLFLFLDINQAARSVPEPIWGHLTVLGDTLMTLSLLLPFIGRKPQLIWTCAVAGLIATIIVHGLKLLLAVPRPSAILDSDIYHLIGPQLASVYSFPSGHTATIFLLAAVIALYFRRVYILLPALLLATLVGLSRIAVGVHWPLDVLGGIFFAWLCAIAGIYLTARWTWGVSLAGQRILAVFIVAIAAYTALLHDTHYDTMQFQQLVILLLLLASISGIKNLWKKN